MLLFDLQSPVGWIHVNAASAPVSRRTEPAAVRLPSVCLHSVYSPGGYCNFSAFSCWLQSSVVYHTAPAEFYTERLLPLSRI